MRIEAGVEDVVHIEVRVRNWLIISLGALLIRHAGLALFYEEKPKKGLQYGER